MAAAAACRCLPLPPLLLVVLPLVQAGVLVYGIAPHLRWCCYCCRFDCALCSAGLGNSNNSLTLQKLVSSVRLRKLTVSLQVFVGRGPLRACGHV
jgi:hypothetical protein